MDYYSLNLFDYFASNKFIKLYHKNVLFSINNKTPFTDCSINGVYYLDIDTDIHILPFGKFEMVNH